MSKLFCIVVIHPTPTSNSATTVFELFTLLCLIRLAAAASHQSTDRRWVSAAGLVPDGVGLTGEPACSTDGGGL